MSTMNQTKQVKVIRDPINGVLLLDKPIGLSSNTALMQAKRLLNAKKAGHTGTLDPFASGLLPLCFGEATKFAHDLLDADKTYETVVHLGVCTDTGDTEGIVLKTQPVNLTLDQITAVLAQFRGDITQIPPMYSALKRDGKPLYEYARAGITLEREARNVIIHELTLLDYSAPWLRLRVTCSKGTYIRVLGEDIGHALGCGAHLNALRRTEVGDFKLDQAIALADLESLSPDRRRSALQPVDAMLSSLAAVQLPDDLASRFMHGQRLPLAEIQGEAVKTYGRVKVYRLNDEQLLGTGQVNENQILAPERLIASLA